MHFHSHVVGRLLRSVPFSCSHMLSLQSSLALLLLLQMTMDTEP